MISVSNVSYIGIINRMREFDGGRGTEANPYRIVKTRHYKNTGKYANAFYRLENDIVFTDEFEPDGEYYNNGALWLPISTFTGVFDGQGYKVENLKAVFSDSNKGGFCNYLDTNSTVKNVYFKSLNIDRTSTSIQHIGGVVGRGNSPTTSLIEAVYVDGYFRTGLRTGGILGINGTLRRCATNLEHIASENSGGLVCGSSTYQYVYDCYTRGSLSCPNHRACIHGATFGARIYRSYSYQVLLGGFNYKRGIISLYDGYNGESYDCYWDTGTTTATISQNYGTGLTVGLTTTQSKYPYPEYNGTDKAYAGWDFDTVWAHDVNGNINNGYPYLRGVTPLPSS